MDFDLSSWASRRNMKYAVGKALSRAKRESYQQSHKHDDDFEAKIGKEAHNKEEIRDSVEVESEFNVGREMASLLIQYVVPTGSQVAEEPVSRDGSKQDPAV